MAMKAIDTICAVGIPKNVQLSARRNSRAKRVVPYQMKKTSSRSPGRSHERSRYPRNTRNAAPSRPEIDSYRNSGWNRVVASG